MTIQEFIQIRPDGPVAKAFALAKQAHAGQKRKSGEPYLNHVVATAETLIQWKLDETTIAAGLLHDVVEDTAVTQEEVQKKFGDQVAFLVNGVTKISRIKYRGAQAQVENLRKLILALSEDMRVIFIKFADRLHNMHTLSALPPLKAKRIAMETDEIYAPLAARVGMQNLAGELHDLAFPYLHPQEEKWLKENVSEKFEERSKYLHSIQSTVEKVLREQNIIPLTIDFRAKRYYSLYHKLLEHNMDVDKIYDLVAMRIIVKTSEECYGALGIIHQHWPPLPGRIKDYIAMPKSNGYRSLHTTVIGPEEKIVEFQIRTEEMHEYNEMGAASHWFYKHRKKDSQNSPAQLSELEWLQQLRAWQEQYNESLTSPEEFLQAMKIEFFKDRIFPITPRGDVIDLPAGATPLDFAYAIHSEVGNTCVGAKVNNRFVPLDFQLRSGDLVEIITQKNKKPSEDWVKFVKTPHAREHIRLAIRAKSKGLEHRGPTKTVLKIVVQDRPGLIKDISSVVARSHINILSFHTTPAAGTKFPIDKIEIATADEAKVKKLVLKLKQIKEIREISYKLI